MAMAKQEILDDLFKFLKKGGDGTEAMLHSTTLAKLPEKFVANLQGIIKGSDATTLDAWYETLIKYRAMSDKDVKALSKTEKAEAQAIRAIAKEDWQELTGNAMRTVLKSERSINSFKQEFKTALFSGQKIDIPALLKKNGLDNTKGTAIEADVTAYVTKCEALTGKRSGEIKILENMLLDETSSIYDKDLVSALEKLPEDQKKASLTNAAKELWAHNYNNGEIGQVNQQSFLGKIDDAKRKELIEQIKMREHAGSQEPVPASATTSGDEAARGFRQRAADAAKAVPAAAINTFKARPIISTVAVGAGSFVLYKMLSHPSSSNSNNNVQPAASGDLPSQNLDKVTDIGDAKSASKDNKKLSEKLMDDYNKSVLSFDSKLQKIDEQIALKTKAGDTNAITALKTLRDQVSNIQSVYVANPKTAFVEATEYVHEQMGAFEVLHQQILALPKDDAQLQEAKLRLTMQQQLLNNVNGTTQNLKVQLNNIDAAIGQAASGNLPTTALDADAKARKAQFDSQVTAQNTQDEAKAREAINSANAPVATLAEAKTKAQNNLRASEQINLHIGQLLSESNKTGAGSIAGGIAEALAFAKSQNDQAEIDKYTSLQNEFNDYIKKLTTASSDTSTKVTEVKGLKGNIDSIGSELLVAQANSQLAKQGALVQDLFKTDRGLTNELSLFATALNKGTTVAALRQNGVTPGATAGGNTAGATSGRPSGNGTPSQNSNGTSAPTPSTNSNGASSGPTGTSPQDTGPKLPPEIAAANADAMVLAKYGNGDKNPATLSDGQTKISYGMQPRIASVVEDIKKAEEQIAKVEQLQIKLRSEGKNAEAVQIENTVINSMRDSLQTMRDSHAAMLESGKVTNDIINKMKTYTQGNQIGLAQEALVQIKAQYDTVAALSQTAQNAKDSSYKRLTANPLTAEMLQNDISSWQKSPNQLLQDIGGGKEGLPYQLFGDANSTGKSVASGYLSLAWKKINDMQSGWKEYGQSLQTQSGRNWWMAADIGGKVVLGSMAINLFNNTLGGMAGFKIDGWKSLAIMGIIAAVGLHGSGETGRAMESAGAVRDNKFGSPGPYAQGGGTIDISRRNTSSNGGSNIPNSGSVAVRDQKTGEIKDVASFTNNKGNITLTSANGEVARITEADVNQVAQNIVLGNGRNVPSNLDGKPALAADHSEGVSDARLASLSKPADAAAQPRA